ncbi:imidazole glycerol phosphate synthase subunit HisH [Elizabethkingia meningoseptica]|uniref:Imidazole glycerol phosphate synthase subunit HisH n=1 Tax=Elizabethkingia meningoseptica TaxID=238 RepID=A0A1V3U230_ELIME|nr:MULTISPECIES: imidazole glycerol phosphate synthase subunit HisH [Elizabethkingia]AQX13904.1 imidazole glycerol phosphate synthase, glutamine amidotransferase subunit [Elizabethkingia meningoseptica]EJK5327824.1 imidazole glycerol phosphate synthase subunit HisH [Elizabethkingia meningoseptica]MBG0515713.1 imidazole glycerol phosphate synthase subunit HisH [Elizabethkingia meningoseptica]MDE5433920.1 imidazole glycerol phosphate synthase subunit HisH [Elizabethkingia meningoseptica]MDE54369
MIAIIKYNAGNVRSVYNAVTRLGYGAVITDDPEILRNAEKVIFPGVGEASSAMKYLQDKGIDQVIKNLKQPVLGICLGQQLLCESSEEGNVKCLGIFDAKVRKFPAEDIVPHMGWNTLTQLKGNIFKDITEGEDVYYVHGFYCELSKDTVATTDYILPFSAAFQRENFYATQFHPEKSALTGEKILRNFLSL